MSVLPVTVLGPCSVVISCASVGARSLSLFLESKVYLVGKNSVFYLFFLSYLVLYVLLYCVILV